jgi:hypothetical protein
MMDRDTLVQAILDLENKRGEAVPDPNLAYELAHHVKPHIDRLAAFRNGNGAEISFDLDDDIESLGAEAEAAAGDEASSSRQPGPKGKKTPVEKGPPEGPVPTLLSVPPIDQARWIFMERFFSLEKHEEILEHSFDADVFAQHQQSFDSFFKNLLLLPKTIEAIERNDVQSLQKTFASHVILFRSPLMGDDTGKPIPCTFETLRAKFPSYFFRQKKKPKWYQRHAFYQEPIPEPRWVLCDTEYLNCTLRRPERKLNSYAKDWDLPGECINQKSVIEDVYDRIVCGEILEEDLFSRNCSSLTATTYRARKKSPQRLVFTVQRVHKIAIHGKAGIPHWKAKKRLWPGAFPVMTFE